MKSGLNLFTLLYQDIVISHCGEIVPGDDWKIHDNDISNDKLPPFPDDWEEKEEDFEVSLSNINFFTKTKD